MPVPPEKLVIATRQSALALWQAEHVRDRLGALYPSCRVELLGLTTQGDRILDVACGTGILGRLIQNRLGAPNRLVGVDINPAMIGVAQRLGPELRTMGSKEMSSASE